MSEKRPKVAFCVPSSETWKSAFGVSAFSLAAVSVQAGIELSIVNHRGGDAAENRNLMVKLGREYQAQWFLFVDADMTFPPNALVRLLAWDVDVAGADYRMRAAPYRRLGLSPQGAPYPPDHVEPEQGLVERGVIGLGCMLVRASVFDKLAPPWFARTWIPQHATPDNPFGFSTDDSYFCHYCHHHGFKVWCDLGLTREVQHIGEINVPWVMTPRRATLATGST